MAIGRFCFRSTCNAIKEINPSIKILLSSGYSLQNQATEIRGHNWDGFIQKPFIINQLSLKIREILDNDWSLYEHIVLRSSDEVSRLVLVLDHVRGFVAY